MRKKMKKYFILLMAAGILATACKGFLDENPTTSLSEKSVYSTEAALDSQIYGILSSFYGRYMPQGYMNELLHTASGLMMWKASTLTATTSEMASLAVFSRVATWQ